MDVIRSDPVCIESGIAEERFPAEQLPADQFSVEPLLDCAGQQCSRGGEWGELEQFWGEEKQRLHDLDGLASKPLSSSPEGHLLHDSFIEQPARCKRSHTANSIRRVSGQDIRDIPSMYAVDGSRPHELIAIGTYVDKRIVPGFPYRVRKIGTDDHLFGGEAKPLSGVGLGYGKRLTFHGDSLNENTNYFWSDSRAGGYGLTLQVLKAGDKFKLVDSISGRQMGRLTVTRPSVSEDSVLSTTTAADGRVQLEADVHFAGDVVVLPEGALRSARVWSSEFRGVAAVSRDRGEVSARVAAVALRGDDASLHDCLLVPME